MGSNVGIERSERIRLLEVVATIDGVPSWEVISFAQALEAYVLGEPIPRRWTLGKSPEMGCDFLGVEGEDTSH